jgi:DNA invertase Pin-like site-specific DNA recombinase
LLAAQREAYEAYVRSQQHAGWALARSRYDAGGSSGGNIDRPALQSLLADIRAGRIDIVIVYKVDRLTRSLAVRLRWFCLTCDPTLPRRGRLHGR